MSQTWSGVIMALDNVLALFLLPLFGALSDKVKTKARGKKYYTGAHGSGAAKHKAEIRQKVKNRPSQRKGR